MKSQDRLQPFDQLEYVLEVFISLYRQKLFRKVSISCVSISLLKRKYHTALDGFLNMCLLGRGAVARAFNPSLGREAETRYHLSPQVQDPPRAT